VLLQVQHGLALYRSVALPTKIGNMMRPWTILTDVLIFLAMLLASTVEAADRTHSLAELSVADSKRVPPEEYREAAAFAAHGNEPLDIVLKLVGKFEGAIQHMIQINEGSESPSACRITVMRDGLMDDSVRGERWDIALEKTAKNFWSIREVRRSWRCWRGEQTDRFATDLCP
jgi:hypothetical protein